MAKVKFTVGQYIREKASPEKVFVVTRFDDSDHTFRAESAIHGNLGWTSSDRYEEVPADVKVLSIQRGAKNKPDRPSSGAEKLRKAKAQVEALKEYEMFL